MVLQWIANPSPSGVPGSIPGIGVLFYLKIIKNKSKEEKNYT